MILVVNYHYIRKDYTQPYPAIFGVTPEGFRKQLEELSKFGTFISQSDLKDRITAQNPPDPEKVEFLITFDDGLREQFEEALPVLNHMGIPAVFFVNSVNFEDNCFSLVHQLHLLRAQIRADELVHQITSHHGIKLNTDETDKAISHYRYDQPETAKLKYLLNFKLKLEDQQKLANALFPKYFPESEKLHKQLYMSKDQLIKLAGTGYLGSHSHRHIPLGLHSESEIAADIRKSRTYLEDLTGTRIDGIAYPYGSREATGHHAAREAAAAGMLFGFTTERAAIFDWNEPLLLPRFNCNDLPGGKSNLYNELTVHSIPRAQWFH